MENIHIYHTNDVHSHFDHWPRIRKLLLERKALHEEAGEECFIFDIGDHMDRFHPYSDATRGKGNTAILNDSGFTAVTIGNNEGITLPYENLNELYKNAQFDVLVANLFNKDGTIPPWAKPYQIYETKQHTKIAVIGLTAYFSHFYGLLGWKLTEPFSELQNLFTTLKKQSDILIVLSHLGIHDDERLAIEFPEIDVILGAHTHHILHTGKVINQTLLAAAGKYGMFVGHVELMADKGKVLDKKAILYNTNELPSVENEDEMIHHWYTLGKEQLSTVFTKVPPKNRTKESLAKILCESLLEWCQADCAFINEGMILKDVETDLVTDFDLLDICPHPINPCLVKLSGDELKEVLLEAEDEKWVNMQMKGFGFRGNLMGKMVYAGIQIDKNEKGTEFSIQSLDIDRNRIYQVAIPDMYTFGMLFPQIQRAKHKTFFFPEFLRDLLKWRLTHLFHE
ncbi:bifunctional metallophosphatase/5'-nucleotidase [Cytobacillus sp. Hz8]|uniref:bifunctional metallophosphatase/5'-nucleotidase n=1 Tax=Cytobacillus sp. Hz8 TaxID=3347168 RepID=UPI0035E2BF10